MSSNGNGIILFSTFTCKALAGCCHRVQRIRHLTRGSRNILMGTRLVKPVLYITIFTSFDMFVLR